MIACSHHRHSRSCAHSLERFAEALKRDSDPVLAISLVRAHTPHTPQGRALKRRPGSLERARSSAQASERTNRYFPAQLGSRGPREQRPIQTEFVWLSGPVLAVAATTPRCRVVAARGGYRGARAALRPRWATIARVAPGRAVVATCHFAAPRQHGQTSSPTAKTPRSCGNEMCEGTFIANPAGHLRVPASPQNTRSTT